MNSSPRPTGASAGTQKPITSTSAQVSRTTSLSRLPEQRARLVQARGVDHDSCASGRCRMPRMACRVVCGRLDVIATFEPDQRVGQRGLARVGPADEAGEAGPEALRDLREPVTGASFSPVSRARISRPIGSAAVAAGEGALSTCSTAPGPRALLDEQEVVDQRAVRACTACARTPAPAGRRCVGPDVGQHPLDLAGHRRPRQRPVHLAEPVAPVLPREPQHARVGERPEQLARA